MSSGETHSTAMAVDQVYTAVLAKSFPWSTDILLDSDSLFSESPSQPPALLCQASRSHPNSTTSTPDCPARTMADLHTVSAPREAEDTETTLRKSSTSRSNKGEATRTADALLGAQSSTGATDTDYTAGDASIDGEAKSSEGSGSQCSV